MRLSKRNKVQEIEFIAWSEYAWNTVVRPFPASQAIPNWWKDYPPYVKAENNSEGKTLSLYGRIANLSFKKCTPMLDSLTSGYYLPLWADVLVRKENGETSISWKVTKDMFEIHGASSTDVERPAGYNKYVYKYIAYWNVVTPPGYSVLITSPYGYRGSSPIKIIDAVFDSDKSHHELVLPCWVRDDFEGVIEQGTPIAQIIPFKRTDWKSKFSFRTEEQHAAILDKTAKRTIVNNYIKHHWSKKVYK